MPRVILIIEVVLDLFAGYCHTMRGEGLSPLGGVGGFLVSFYLVLAIDGLFPLLFSLFRCPLEAVWAL